jgi:protein-L-isoaspartate(D-aspartate) O-methyltransferase
MVDEQLAARDVTDSRVLEAMRAVPRHLFVPEAYRSAAYADQPLPIGHGQTISQPEMVAVMIQALELRGDERLLDIGAGSGYAAAVLGRLAREVIAVEVVPELARAAEANLAKAEATNVSVVRADGSAGYPERAPYDAIIVAAGAPRIPEALRDQLAEGGRLVVPVGDRMGQRLVRVRRTGGEFEEEPLMLCAFVPLVGEGGWTGNGS